MAALGVQILAWVPGAVDYVLQARPQHLKVLDVAAEHTMPSGVRVLVIEYLCGEIPGLEIDYRRYMDVGTQQRLLADPVRGARELASIVLLTIDPVRRHIAYVEGPNETGLWGDADAYNLFTAEYAYQLHREGMPSAAYNFPVGNPPGYYTGDANLHPDEFRAGLAAYWEHYYRQIPIDPDAEVKMYYDGIRESDYIAKHEYSAPTMQAGAPYLCGRFQLDWETLPPDCQDKPFVITEAGIDGGVLGGRPREECGWQKFCDEGQYLEQIQWYDALIAAANAKPKGPRVKAVHLFHAGSADSGWDSFSILGADRIAEYIRNQRREKPTMPDFQGDFARFAAENPRLKLTPTSEAIHLSEGRAVQLANKGALVYVPGDRTTLHKPYRPRKKA